MEREPTIIKWPTASLCFPLVLVWLHWLQCCLHVCPVLYIDECMILQFDLNWSTVVIAFLPQQFSSHRVINSVLQSFAQKCRKFIFWKWKWPLSKKWYYSHVQSCEENEKNATRLDIAKVEQLCVNIKGESKHKKHGTISLVYIGIRIKAYFVLAIFLTRIYRARWIPYGE